MADQTWEPVGVDVSVPNAARMYDYFLGGKDNFPADRAAAEKIIEFVPEVTHVVRENRRFMARAVRYLAEAGIRQFVDVGTGLPTREPVHEVARRVAPDARVAYVDHDPVVLAHARALLAGAGNVAVVAGDLREPEAFLADPGLHDMIDFSEPVAVLLLAVLHFVPDSGDPAGLVARLRAPLAPGSHLVVTHATPQDSRLEDVPKVMDVYNSSTAPVTLREGAEILPFFEGWELVEPGLAYVSGWRPDRPPAGPDRSRAYAGVARLA